MANNVALSPPDTGRISNAEAQVQQDSVAALHRVLCGESVAEKERRVSEMILQLQLIREQLLQQQDQSKVSSNCTYREHALTIESYRAELSIECILDTSRASFPFLLNLLSNATFDDEKSCQGGEMDLQLRTMNRIIIANC